LSPAILVRPNGAVRPRTCTMPTLPQKDAKPEELEGTLDVKIGYDKSVWLVGLVSQEVYSRFNSMLTIHGFFLSRLRSLIHARRERGARTSVTSRATDSWLVPLHPLAATRQTRYSRTVLLPAEGRRVRVALRWSRHHFYRAYSRRTCRGGTPKRGIHISAYSGGGYFAFPMCLSLYACCRSRGDCGSDVSGEVSYDQQPNHALQ